MNNNLKNSNILIVGDVMLDKYYQGSTSRISPEAPVPVVKVNDVLNKAGGAGNVALNITSLNGNARLIGLIGDDESGKILSNSLAKNAVKTNLIKTKNSTITKLRILCQHQQLIRLDFEDKLKNTDIEKLKNIFNNEIKKVNTLILSDYGKGVLFDAQYFIQKAIDENVIILIDPKKNNFDDYRNATIITPNLKEFEEVVGVITDENDMISKAKNVLKKYNITGLLITRSENGMTLIINTGEVCHLATKAKEVFDVTGAGDTVIAVFAMGLSSGYSYSASMKLANTSAGIVVGKIGTATVSQKELNQSLCNISNIKYGVLDTNELLVMMNSSRLQGEKIVMTNGCFDILHAGHIDYLTEAKLLGDRLIVAVNTDDSVRRLKGDTRPIVDLENRMKLLSSLSCVDWVVCFSEDTPLNIIKKVLPDVLIKGADYEIDKIIGAKEIIKNGGEVKTINLTVGCSTSLIINKILKTK